MVERYSVKQVMEETMKWSGKNKAEIEAQDIAHLFGETSRYCIGQI
jgi:hypothetical protein